MKRYGSKSRSCRLKPDAVTLPVLENYSTLTRSIGLGKQQQQCPPSSSSSSPSVSLHLCLNVCVCISTSNKDAAFHISHFHPEVSEKSKVPFVRWRSFEVNTPPKSAEFLISLICSVAVWLPWSSGMASTLKNKSKWMGAPSRVGALESQRLFMKKKSFQCKHYSTEQRTDPVVWSLARPLFHVFWKITDAHLTCISLLLPLPLLLVYKKSFTWKSRCSTVCHMTL